ATISCFSGWLSTRRSPSSRLRCSAASSNRAVIDSKGFSPPRKVSFSGRILQLRVIPCVMIQLSTKEIGLLKLQPVHRGDDGVQRRRELRLTRFPGQLQDR